MSSAIARRNGCVLVLAVVLAAAALPPRPLAAQHGSLSYARIYPDNEGVSRFDDHEIAWSPLPSLHAWTTPLQEARSVGFLRLPEGFSQDYHAAPRKQFLVVMQGLFEITAGSGETRVFPPGSVLLVEDTTGQGHKTRNAGPGEVLVARVPVPPDTQR